MTKFAETGKTKNRADSRRLRQCVDHPLLVLGKATEEDEAESKLLDADGNEEQSLKQMIAMYAGGADDSDAKFGSNGDSEYAMKVLKEIEEAEGTSECMICASEIFDEVLLPCYHRG